MKESELWATFKKALDKWGDGVRIENSAGQGVPDVNYAIVGRHGWIELKIAKHGKLYFEKFQLPWLRRRLRHLDHLWVLAVVDGDLCLYHAAEILAADSTVETAGKKTMTVVKVEDLDPEVRGPSPWPWSLIYTKLTGIP